MDVITVDLLAVYFLLAFVALSIRTSWSVPFMILGSSLFAILDVRSLLFPPELDQGWLNAVRFIGLAFYTFQFFFFTRKEVRVYLSTYNSLS
jgi:hypothetical protein